MFEDNNIENLEPQNETVAPKVENITPREEPAQVEPAAVYEEPAPAYRASYHEPQAAYSQPATPRFDPYMDAPKKKKKSGGAGKLIAVALCCSLIGSALGAGITLTLMDREPAEAQPPVSNMLEGIRQNSVLEVHKIDTSKVMTPAEVYATNVQSTVGITTAITTNYWGFQTTSAASGSGFILTDDGYVLTNYHVVEGSTSISVAMYDGKNYDAQLIGYDEANDIAVLKIEAENLPAVILGDSDNLNVGDSVVAIGNPLGELTFSLTSGAISALDRQVTMSSGTTMNLMQTDCAINSGNSGGALFNLYGEVIGITNAKYSSSSSSEASIDNIGFAIPLNNVKKIVESLIKNGYISKPYIGVSVADVSEETQSYGLPKGAAVRSVVADSPAEAAGLQTNDIITAVDGKEITSSNDLVSTIGEAEIGQVLKLTVYRKGVTIEIELTVGEQIQQGLQEEVQQQQQPSQDGFSGFPFWGFGGY